LGFLKVYVSVFGSYEMMYARCYAHRANAKVQRGCWKQSFFGSK